MIISLIESAVYLLFTVKGWGLFMVYSYKGVVYLLVMVKEVWPFILICGLFVCCYSEGVWSTVRGVWLQSRRCGYSEGAMACSLVIVT